MSSAVLQTLDLVSPATIDIRFSGIQFQLVRFA